MTTVPFDLVLRNCRLEGSSRLADIGITSGLIAQIGEIDGDTLAELDVEGRLVSPAFVEPHIHLDKVGTLPLLGENRTGTLAEAIDILHRTKRSATPEEIAARAGVVIRQAVVAGTTSIRSHVDVDTVRRPRTLARSHAGRQGARRSLRHPDRCLSAGRNHPRPGHSRPHGRGHARGRRRRRRHAALGNG